MNSGQIRGIVGMFNGGSNPGQIAKELGLSRRVVKEVLADVHRTKKKPTALGVVPEVN